MYYLTLYLHAVLYDRMDYIVKSYMTSKKNKIPFLFFAIVLTLLKKKYIKIHTLFTKFIQNNIIFNYTLRKSNTFVNIMKSNKIILSRSLGTLGINKNKEKDKKKNKKRKMEKNINYLLGSNFINLVTKLNLKNKLKRIMININGFRRFLRATISGLKHHIGKTRYMFNKNIRRFKRWFVRKNRIIKRCHRKKIAYRMTFKQRRRETSLKRDRIKLSHQLFRISFIKYNTSVAFGGHNPGRKKHFERYVFRKYY